MSASHVILLIEPRAEVREIFKEQFAHYPEFKLIEFERVEAACAWCVQAACAVVLINGEEAERAGVLLNAQLQSQEVNTLVLAIQDEGAPLLSYIDDYMFVPLRFQNLLRRIRAHVTHMAYRQAAQALPEVQLPMGRYMFEPRARQLVDEAGEIIRLTEKEAAILWFMAQVPEQIVTKETLLKEVWGYNTQVMTHTLETHIYRLRQKISQDLFINEGGGYRLAV